MVPLVLNRAIAKPQPVSSRSITKPQPVRLEDGRLAFSTGITALDEALGGGLPVGLTLIMGLQKTGKTALARRIERGGLVDKGRQDGTIQWSDRPVLLFDDVIEHPRFIKETHVRSKRIGDFFRLLHAHCLEQEKGAVITITGKKDLFIADRYLARLSAMFLSSVAIKTENLDYWGRGEITVLNNRHGGFMGEMTI